MIRRYLEGPGVRAGPFGSQGLCMDLRNRQSAPGAFQCAAYERFYWLVVDTGMGTTAALTPMPFTSLQACLDTRARLPVARGRSAYCTRRTPTTKPLPGTAGVPSLPGTASRT